MAITNRDQLIAALATSFNTDLTRISQSSQTAGIRTSTWRINGNKVVPAIPTTAATPTNLTGGIPIPSVTTETIYIAGIMFTNTIAGQFFICDRLAHMGGLSGVSTSAQAANIDISTAAGQGRCQADGSDVQWFLEWYTATGGTAVTATITYTNSANTTGRTTTVSLAATRPIACTLPIYPATSDSAIKSIQSVTLSATTGTAGNFGVTATKQLINFPLVIANTGIILDYAGTGLCIVNPNSHLMTQFIPASTSTGAIFSNICFIKG